MLRDIFAFMEHGWPDETSKPNIVLVLMDSFEYGKVGVYGGGVLRGAFPRLRG